MIITCPNCQTRYQLANDTIGSAGRKVQCANCQTSWQATPEFPRPKQKPYIAATRADDEIEDDRLFDANDESGLDAAFSIEEKMLAARAQELESPSLPEVISKTKSAQSEAALSRKQQKAFSKRRDDLISSLPYAKVRRTLRLAGGVLLLGLVGGGIYFRTDVVRQFPDLAGIYQQVGLAVNVTGLEFRDVKTLLARKDGSNVMTIDATIASVNKRRTNVPQVVVTLLGPQNEALYEWSVTADASDLGPGEIVKFQAQLANPPKEAQSVKLTFVGGHFVADKSVTSASVPSVAEPVPGVH